MSAATIRELIIDQMRLTHVNGRTYKSPAAWDVPAGAAYSPGKAYAECLSNVLFDNFTKTSSLWLPDNSAERVSVAQNGTVSIGKLAILTVDGYEGMAIRVTTRQTVAKGNILQWSQTDDERVEKATSAAQMPVGFAAAAANAGEALWMIYSGYAWVQFKTGVTPTRGYIAFVSSVDGEADCSASVPVNDHWREIGHIVKTAASGALALIGAPHYN